jgi:hypothetical protein
MKGLTIAILKESGGEDSAETTEYIERWLFANG